MPPINPTGPGPVDVSQSKFFVPGLIGSVVPTPTASFIAEEDGDWWAYIQKFGAPIALAAAVIATSLSTSVAAQAYSFHQDELPNVPNEEHWTQPPPQAIPVTSRIWTLQGQGSAAFATYQLEEENYYPPVTVPQAITFRDQWTYDVQELSPTWLGEDYYLSSVFIQPVFQFPQLFDGDEFIAPSAFLPNEEYPWNLPVIRPQTRLWNLQGQGSAASTTYQLPEEDWFPSVVVQPAPVIPQQWIYDAVELPQPPAPIAFEEVAWIVAPPPEPTTTVLLFLDEGSFTYFQPEEDFYQSPVFVAPYLYQVQPQWTYDIEIPGTQKAVVEDYWFIQTPYSVISMVYQPPYSFDAGELPQAVTTKFVSWICEDDS